MNQESILGPDFQEVGEEARNWTCIPCVSGYKPSICCKKRLLSAIFHMILSSIFNPNSPIFNSKAFWKIRFFSTIVIIKTCILWIYINQQVSYKISRLLTDSLKQQEIFLNFELSSSWKIQHDYQTACWTSVTSPCIACWCRIVVAARGKLPFHEFVLSYQDNHY